MRALMSLFADLEVDGWAFSVWDCVSWASVESKEFVSNIFAIDVDASTFSTDS